MNECLIPLAGAATLGDAMTWLEIHNYRGQPRADGITAYALPSAELLEISADTGACTLRGRTPRRTVLATRRFPTPTSQEREPLALACRHTAAWITVAIDRRRPLTGPAYSFVTGMYAHRTQAAAQERVRRWLAGHPQEGILVFADHGRKLHSAHMPR